LVIPSFWPRGIGGSTFRASRQDFVCNFAGRVVPEAGLEPARPRGRGIFVPLRLSPPASRRSWPGARLRPSLPALGARRLLSTPSRLHGLGSASARSGSRAFAEFDGFRSARFRAGAQIALQVPCVYRFHHSGDGRSAAIVPPRPPRGRPAQAAPRIPAEEWTPMEMPIPPEVERDVRNTEARS
jgi:hypothetical protein